MIFKEEIQVKKRSSDIAEVLRIAEIDGTLIAYKIYFGGIQR
jgi:hypothetical protein